MRSGSSEFDREDIIPRGRELEGPLAEALAPLASHPAVAEVRAGLGLLAAVQLDYELPLVGEEIGDIRPQRYLAPELGALELSVA